MKESSEAQKARSCRVCKITIAPDSVKEYFYWNKSLASYEGICKGCKAKQRREREGIKQRRQVDTSSGGRPCTVCGLWKKNFLFRDRVKTKKGYRKITRGECISCENNSNIYRQKMADFIVPSHRAPGRQRTLLVLTLPDVRPWSVNKIWAGVPWPKRKKYADQAIVEMLEVYPDAVMSGELFPLSEKIDIWVHLYFKNEAHAQDPGNPLTKPHIDAMIGRVIEEDDMNHIGYVAHKIFIDKERPRMEIIITKAYD